MKAVIYSQYGGPEVLQLADVPVPTPDSHGVLVRVKTVSINPLDWSIRHGSMKLMAGASFPKGVGIDFSGVVESVGGLVTELAVGDAVFGAVEYMKGRALAEFVAVPAKQVWPKPAAISFEQAACLPVVGSAAYEALHKLSHVTTGSTVLLNGASGGVGMLTTQLAKQLGAVVTAVAGPAGIPFLQQWGIEHTIDYTRQDIRNLTDTFDVVFDLSGKLSFDEAKPLMNDHAVYINPVPKPVEIITSAVTNLLSGKKDKTLMSSTTDESIRYLIDALQKGLRIEVSKTFPIEEFGAAYQFAEKGNVIGKVVFTV